MMVRLILLTAFATSLFGCASDDSTVLADVQWTLACPASLEPGETCMGLSPNDCPGSFTGRRVNQFDSATVCNGDLVRATCRVSPAGGSLNLDLGVTVAADNYVFEVDRLLVDASGSVQESSACEVRVIEDELDYFGSCSAAAPSEERPCQIADVTITGTTIDVDVLCDKILSEVPDEVANIRGPGTAGAATLHFENCEGL